MYRVLHGNMLCSLCAFLTECHSQSISCRRDLVAMTSTVDSSTISNYSDFYNDLLKVLASQVLTMEQDFFEVSG